MKGLPDLVFIVDVGREDAAVHECNILNIPIVALVDTNCGNPEGVDYVIPSNDDAIRAIKLLVGKMADAALEGRAMRKDIEPEMEMSQAVETGAPVAAPDKRQAHPAVEMEVELGDDALLGKSTLAKLTTKPEVKAEPVEIVEEVVFEEVEVEEEDVSAALADVVAEPAEPDVFEEPVEEPELELVEESVEEPVVAAVEPEVVKAAEPVETAPVNEEPAPAKKRTSAVAKHEEPKKAVKKPAASKPEAKKPAKKPAATKTASKSKTTKK